MEGIWNSEELGRFDPLPSARLSLGEGNTPFKFVELEGGRILGIKDENHNPNGSFKDRSLAYQLSMYQDQGAKRFVISSSGNAAIAAAAFVKLMGAELDVFIASKINPKKLAKLHELAKGYPGIRLRRGRQPKSDAIKFARENGAVNLRGSQDELAVPGFKTIAYELLRQYPETDAVFVPCSSGTSTLALCRAFKDMERRVAVYVCQTTRIHPIAREFQKSFQVSDESLADAISDRVALRKAEVVAALKDNGGGGLIISDQELRKAEELTVKYGFSFSYNSLLGFAAYLIMEEKPAHPVVIASGL